MPKGRGSGPWLLVLPVLALHALLATWWPGDDRFGLGDDSGAPAPTRIEVAFVRELKPAAPVPVPRPAVTRRLRAIAPPAAASGAAAALEQLAEAETPAPWPGDEPGATALQSESALPRCRRGPLHRCPK
ncbi:MAG: hypothetical protein U1F67_06300 [Rubrivivax sp.]